ncbi:MAG: FAD-dependent oxidoreductase [Gammaproteobacteria bacterium]|nr:MAG: FAD-dependent oxidoreductase [Gammaproteobacteria bacterium]
MTTSIIVIGAGVVGASTALALQKDGHQVTLVDRDSPCSGASFGNAGAIVNGSCVPTAMPGTIFDVMSMLSQPLSPLSIKASYFPKILPWLMRFILQSRTRAVDDNSKHLHALSKTAVASWQKLTANSEISCLLRQTGWLKVYESDKSFDGTKKSRELVDKIGTPYEILNASQIHDLEPNLAPIFKRGFYQKDSLSIINPDRLVKGMVELFVAEGGTYKQFEVKTIKTTSDKVEISDHKNSLSADKIVIATGAWSRTLAKQLGDSIPLDTERGYHLMMPESTKKLLNRPVLNGENSFVLSPMETGLRMTSQVEFAGLKAKPNYKHIRNLLPAVKRMLPKVDTSEQSVWLGFRPSIPDSLPVIGFSTRSDRVLYAFGHHHLGMTLGAITGLTIADLVAKRQTAFSLTPYQANRF